MRINHKCFDESPEVSFYAVMFNLLMKNMPNLNVVNENKLWSDIIKQNSNSKKLDRNQKYFHSLFNRSHQEQSSIKRVSTASLLERVYDEIIPKSLHIIVKMKLLTIKHFN